MLIVCGQLALANDYRSTIDLAGEWMCRYGADSAAVTLPGTTDTNHIGILANRTDETTHLTRLRSYVGEATFSRSVTIPADWKGHNISLQLGRSKPACVYVDGNFAASDSSVSTGYNFDLSKLLTPGKHRIDITVDNSSKSVPEQLLGSSHAYTEDTQTNWNGIIGDIKLTAVNKLNISSLNIIGNASQKSLVIDVGINGKVSKKSRLEVAISPYGKDNYRTIYSAPLERNGCTTIAWSDTTLKLWSEFHPTLYTVRAEIVGSDAVEQTIGLRDFGIADKHFTVNGHKTYLRGKHDACVFPLTAHTPMDFVEWQRYFRICKQYGINHVRFHSWCPPEACFLAADVEGVYLQPELPFWGDFNKDDARLMSYLLSEGKRIIETYSHHPSFVMMALGNELWGDIESMNRFTDSFRSINDRLLYTFGSNYYLGYQGCKPGMDFFVTCRNGGEAWGSYNTHTRGSFSFADAYDGGIINHFAPNTIMTLDEGCHTSEMPIISHETGQFQSYPDYKEIRKYYGVLYPYNLETFRERLQSAGMLDQAEDFHAASEVWSALLYKADIELDLRTSEMAGFQLLDLQDYPGQGSAYIGILDAFMDSKEYIPAKAWRGFCSSVVPLFITEKFCYEAGEKIRGTVKLANYSETDLSGKSLTWSITDNDKKVISAGELSVPSDNIGLSELGAICVDYCNNKTASQLTLELTICGNTNSYTIWTYPSEPIDASLEKGIIITDKFNEDIADKLNRGARVLFMPDSTQLSDKTIEPLFQTDYWNYRMFRTICENNKKAVSPGTLGLLIDNTHPIFRDFPTEYHTDLQWFSIIKASRSLILDNAPAGYRPIVQTIDNVERNHKLGLIFEFSVGSGKLLLCMSQLRTILDQPEARQLYRGILKYMQSEEFAPKTELSVEQLNDIFRSAVRKTQLEELNNISF
jgi:hypothetical protein